MMFSHIHMILHPCNCLYWCVCRHFCEQAYVRSNNNKYHSKAASVLRHKLSEKQLQNNDLDVIQVSAKSFTGCTEAIRYLSVGHEIGSVLNSNGAPAHSHGEDRWVRRRERQPYCSLKCYA